MARKVKQRVDFGDADLLGSRADFDYVLTGFNLSFGDDPEVEPRATVGDQQCGHLRFPQPQADPVTGHPRLADFEDGLADPVSIADANLIVRQTLDREILAEMAGLQVVAVQFARPIPVGVKLIHQHGAVFATVPTEVALAVAVDIEPADHPRARHRLLPHSGVDGATVPRDVLRQTDVDRYQGGHSRDPFVRARQSIVSDASRAARLL